METRKRKDVKKEETWALEDLYQNEDACREDARLLEEELKAFTARKGTLHQSGEILFETLEAYIPADSSSPVPDYTQILFPHNP